MAVGGRDISVFPFRYLKKCRFLGIFENYVISNTFNGGYTHYKPENANKNKELDSKKANCCQIWRKRKVKSFFKCSKTKRLTVTFKHN